MLFRALAPAAVRSRATLVALAAAVTPTSVAAAGPDATNQRVAIDMKIYPQKMFVLTPLDPFGTAEA